jgi:hypothetical protein
VKRRSGERAVHNVKHLREIDGLWLQDRKIFDPQYRSQKSVAILRAKPPAVLSVQSFALENETDRMPFDDKLIGKQEGWWGGKNWKP